MAVSRLKDSATVPRRQIRRGEVSFALVDSALASAERRSDNLPDETAQMRPRRADERHRVFPVPGEMRVGRDCLAQPLSKADLAVQHVLDVVNLHQTKRRADAKAGDGGRVQRPLRIRDPERGIVEPRLRVEPAATVVAQVDFEEETPPHGMPGTRR